jgi:hypothetical protein
VPVIEWIDRAMLTPVFEAQSRPGAERSLSGKPQKIHA